MKTKRMADDSDFAVARSKWLAAVSRAGLSADTLLVASLLVSQADREEFERTGQLMIPDIKELLDVK